MTTMCQQNDNIKVIHTNIAKIERRRNAIAVDIAAQGSVTVLGYKCTIDNYNFNSSFVMPYYSEKEIATSSNSR